METAGDTRTATPVGWVAVALAAGATACLATADALGILSPSAEAAFILLWLAGVLFLVWAAILGVVSAVIVARELSRRRFPAVEIALVIATVAVIGAVVAAHPLFGSSSGIG